MVALVSEHIDDCPSRALLSPIHQLPELLLLFGPRFPLSAEALASGILVFRWVGKDGHRIVGYGRAARHQKGQRNKDSTTHYRLHI